MNRQQKRHPKHPLLPFLYPSKKRIIDKENPKTSTVSKGYPRRRKDKWKVI